ncbi:GTPase-associated system all-helical protein GASH [Nitrosomonas sp. Is37]|uniref:GTPase-associated system all-helical protein GASH n=1 Tax=Nitrosomonas sp. Is37 TaxID=3080535 RepID=UPI00294B7E69|nr:GTPase-associated system all-helical protein GASH [Nitrosomonas sp. Is37]MDV6344774.1 GTPase-associated system all-helical protein GASH [Nitrosomonas sp. Is37]
MTDLLTELLSVWHIENINGHDERFEKIQHASEALANTLRQQPRQLVPAILSGLSPNIVAEAPAILQAEEALISEWKTVRTVFTDSPVNLLRAILLAACQQAAEDQHNAAILWLTAADTLPLLKLGKEEPVIRNLLKTWATSTEELAFVGFLLSDEEQIEVQKLDLPKPTKAESLKVDRDALLQQIEASVGPSSQNGYQLVNPNQHWSNQQQHWSYQFAPRMRNLLADVLDGLTTKLQKSQSEYLIKLANSVSDILYSQQNWIMQTRQAEQIRINALWWSEALYSSSLQHGYRELSPTIASAVMAIDLLNTVSAPTPASVSYLLAETVNRLPAAGFEQKLPLTALFESLKNHSLPNKWLKPFTSPPETGCLSLRDAAVLILNGQETQIDNVIQRIGTEGTFELSLPRFAQALFRQEQAVRLAEVAHE